MADEKYKFEPPIEGDQPGQVSLSVWLTDMEKWFNIMGLWEVVSIPEPAPPAVGVAPAAPIQLTAACPEEERREGHLCDAPEAQQCQESNCLRV